jgi:SAM-dependent methyltransferase
MPSEKWAQPMSDAEQKHADQIAFWNGPSGSHWVAQQAHTDAQLQPVTHAVLAAASATPGQRILDIGCGCGTTTMLLGEAVGLAGHVTGVDISEPMLGWARQRGGDRRNIDWLLADAASHAFAPASYDLLFSRFGVMFFGDPTAAFAHLRGVAKPGARLVFACWRPFAENPWMRIPLHAAYEHVPKLPKTDPNDPGPFAFADPGRVMGILTGAGWATPSITPLDVSLDIAAGGGLERAVEQATNIGPASRALREAAEESRPAAIAAIRQALARYQSGETVKLPGAVWVVISENQ